MMNIKVLGLGNEILSDDAVGPAIAKELRKCVDTTNATISTSSAGGFRLLDELIGYDKVIIIDAIISDRGQPGDHYWLQLDELRSPVRSRSNHNLHLAEAIELGRSLGMEMPEEVKVLAIEVEDCFTLHEGMSEPVKRVVLPITSIIARHLSELLLLD